MPTPIGHTLAGLAVWAVMDKAEPSGRRTMRERMGWALLCVASANIPDADFITWSNGALTLNGLRHHGLTHSLGYALGFSSVVWLWAVIRGYGGARRVFIATLACYATHLALDVFSVDTYPINGIGLPLFWPLSSAYVIVPLLNPVDRANPLVWASAYALCVEIVVCSLLFIPAMLTKRPDNKKSG